LEDLEFTFIQLRGWDPEDPMKVNHKSKSLNSVHHFLNIYFIYNFYLLAFLVFLIL